MPDRQSETEDRGDSTTPTLSQDMGFVPPEPSEEAGPPEEANASQGQSGDAERTEVEPLDLGGRIGKVERDSEGGIRLTKEQAEQTDSDLRYHRRETTQTAQRFKEIEVSLKKVIETQKADAVTAKDRAAARKSSSAASKLAEAIENGDKSAIEQSLQAAIKAGIVSASDASAVQAPEKQPNRTPAQSRDDDVATVMGHLRRERLDFTQDTLDAITDRATKIFQDTQSENPGADASDLVRDAVVLAHKESTKPKSAKPRPRTRTAASGASAGEFDGATSEKTSGRRPKAASDVLQWD